MNTAIDDLDRLIDRKPRLIARLAKRPTLPKQNNGKATGFQQVSTPVPMASPTSAMPFSM
jgi:hypothetical protein